ncbi:MAG: hypothetical protein FJ042_04870 [Candidatus Cloacimonetes bacterium]|nr:hypothetical protein [Candidatus Cloacimonadota bacterium]
MLRPVLVLLVALVLLADLGAQIQPDHVIEEVTEGLLPYIDTTLPVVIEITAGDWTIPLQTELRARLLELGTDIREVDESIQIPENLWDDQIPEQVLLLSKLSALGLSEVIVVQIRLDLQWQIREQRKFFSYKRERLPLYSFHIKCMQLPDFRLLRIGTYTVVGKSNPIDRTQQYRLKWFEPVIATVAIGSIIYLLWTIE